MKLTDTMSRMVPILAVAAILASIATILPPASDATAKSKDSPCRKHTGISYPGGKGAPHFRGITNAESYEPITDTSGRRDAVRDLIEVHNTSEANCQWVVVSDNHDWLNLSQLSGTLGTDEYDTIRVSVNNNARKLRPGNYKARIKFRLGPESDRWYGYANVTLEVLDKCHIKIRDATGLDIADGDIAANWTGTIGRSPEPPLQHRVVVWNSSNSQCRLSTQTEGPWLEARFEGDSTIGKYGETSLLLSANDHWDDENPGRHKAAITIKDAISGAEYHLHVVLKTEYPPCELAVTSAGHLNFDGVARSETIQEAQVRLENTGGDICHWKAASKQPWLKITPAEGYVWGNNFGDPVTIAIVDTAANGLTSTAGKEHPHTGAVTFTYPVRGIIKTQSVTVALRLSKPSCEMKLHAPEAMDIYYAPGESINPEHHHLELEVSNTPDSTECRYQAELPDWLESNESTGTVPEGESRTITVKLKADTPQAQAAQQHYTGIITIAEDDAPFRDVPVELKTGCRTGDVCAYLHTTHTEINAGEPAEMTYTVSNSSNQPVTAQLTMDLPSGWSLQGEGFADKCSGGSCTKTIEVPALDQQYIAMLAIPNHDGEFELAGRTEYIRFGQTDPYDSSRQAVTINVLPQVSSPDKRPSATTVPQPTRLPDPTRTPEKAVTPAATADSYALYTTVVDPVPHPYANAPSRLTKPPSPDYAGQLESVGKQIKTLTAVVIVLAVVVIVLLAVFVALLLRGRRPHQRVALIPVREDSHSRAEYRPRHPYAGRRNRNRRSGDGIHINPGYQSPEPNHRRQNSL